MVEAGVYKFGEVMYKSLYTHEIDFATYFAAIPDHLATVPWAPLAYMGFFTTSFTLFIEVWGRPPFSPHLFAPTTIKSRQKPPPPFISSVSFSLSLSLHPCN